MDRGNQGRELQLLVGGGVTYKINSFTIGVTFWSSAGVEQEMIVSPFTEPQEQDPTYALYNVSLEARAADERVGGGGEPPTLTSAHSIAYDPSFWRYQSFRMVGLEFRTPEGLPVPVPLAAAQLPPPDWTPEP